MRFKQILPRFAALGILLFLVMFFIIAPFFGKGEHARLVLDLSIIGVLVLAVYICADNKRNVIVAFIVASPALIRLLYPTIVVDEVTLFFNASFLAFVIYILLSKLFRANAVTVDLIYVAIAVYLLLGIFWGLVYSSLEYVWNGSFRLPQGYGMTYAEVGQDLIYFSFVTLATLGYGDIIPLSPPAKFMAVLEAMMGQIYLAVLVAHLVGTRIAQGKSSN